MKKIKISRLFHGFASPRSYLVEEAIKEKQGIILECEGKQMTIPPEEVETRIVKKNKEQFKSKHDNRIYCLYDYIWTPDPDLSPRLF